MKFPPYFGHASIIRANGATSTDIYDVSEMILSFYMYHSKFDPVMIVPRPRAVIRNFRFSSPTSNLEGGI